MKKRKIKHIKHRGETPLKLFPSSKFKSYFYFQKRKWRQKPLKISPSSERRRRWI